MTAQEALEAARQAWPQVSVTTERLEAYIAARAPANGGARSLHTSDLYLACALEAGDPQALVAFEGSVMPAIDPILLRMGLQPSDVDEVKQRLRDSLLVAEAGESPGITSYSGQGPLIGWLRVVAARQALKLGRAKTVSLANDDAIFDATAAPGDPELEALKLRHGPALQAAFDDALRALDSRSQNLLRQHLVDGLTIDELAPLYSSHRATVARWIANAKASLVDKTRSGLQERLQLDTRDCDSLILALQSQLHISLRLAKP